MSRQDSNIIELLDALASLHNVAEVETIQCIPHRRRVDLVADDEHLRVTAEEDRITIEHVNDDRGREPIIGGVTDARHAAAHVSDHLKNQ